MPLPLLLTGYQDGGVEEDEWEEMIKQQCGSGEILARLALERAPEKETGQQTHESVHVFNSLIKPA